MINLPTRVTSETSTIVDKVFTNNISDSIKSGVIKSDFSDHYSQFISVRNQKISLKSINTYARDYSKFSEEDFYNDVSIQNFKNDFTDVKDLFKDFYLKLEGCVERHAPLNKLNPKEISLRQKPWITSELKKMIKIKNKYFYRKKRQPENETIKRVYKLFRSRVNRELFKTKEAYYYQYFRDNRKDSKKMWEGIKSIINTKNRGLNSISQLEVKEKLLMTILR